MIKQSTTFLLSLLAPGLGYYHKGDNKSFYKTIIVFFSILATGVIFRLFVSFWGLMGMLFSILALYAITTIHAMRKAEYRSRSGKSNGLLKLCFTLTFLLVTSLTFANRRTLMGFDIMSMEVAVMQPTLLKGERLLVDTWVQKNELKRGTIVVHSFSGQRGLYLNRIVAVESDRVEIKGGILIINGQVQPEAYILAANTIKPESRNMSAVLIPAGHYFVMGDNRDASFGDSRFSGTIAIENIAAIPTDILTSPDKGRIGRNIH
jgi:signal peptidase I